MYFNTQLENSINHKDHLNELSKYECSHVTINQVKKQVFQHPEFPFNILHIIKAVFLYKSDHYPDYYYRTRDPLHKIGHRWGPCSLPRKGAYWAGPARGEGMQEEGWPHPLLGLWGPVRSKAGRGKGPWQLASWFCP